MYIIVYSLVRSTFVPSTSSPNNTISDGAFEHRTAKVNSAFCIRRLPSMVTTCVDPQLVISPVRVHKTAYAH